MMEETATHDRIPEGSFEAWANPDVRVPKAYIENLWGNQLEELMTLDNKSHLAQGSRSILTHALKSTEGEHEYYSLGGYSMLERSFFKTKHWGDFTRENPDIAPYLEHLRVKVHAILRLDFQPEIVENIRGFLEAADSPEWTPDFFKRHPDKEAQSLHTWVKTHVKGFDGRPNWNMIIDRLPIDLKDKFSIMPAGKKIPTEEIIPLTSQTIDEVILANGYWTPSMLEYQWQSLYEKLTQKFRTPSTRGAREREDLKDRPNWAAVLEQLPEHQRAKFKWHFGRETQYRTEQDAVEQLKDILTQLQPKTWGPSWMERIGLVSLYRYWGNHFRTPEGNVDWQRLISQLPENLKEGFTGIDQKFPKKLQQEENS